MDEEYTNEQERPVSWRELTDLRRECQEEVNQTREEIQDLRRELERLGVSVRYSSLLKRWSGDGWPRRR